VSEITYNVAVDGLTLSSDRKRGDAQLVRLFCELTMGGVGRCVLIVAHGEYQLPGLQTKVEVSLDAGDGVQTVFTGIVTSIGASASEVRIESLDQLYTLGRIGFSKVFENTTAGEIAREILRHAGIQPGTIELGPNFVSYTLHLGPSALQHLRRVASLCGLDAFCDGKGQVHVCGPATKGSEHVFPAHERVLSLDLYRANLARDGYEVWGEGAASTEGAGRSHWLTTDLAGVSGRAAITEKGDVQKDRNEKSCSWSRDGSLRTGEAAANVVKNVASARAERRIRGQIEVLGAPQVRPGDLIRIDPLPLKHAARALLKGSKLRARCVQHSLTTGRGFLTRMEF